jgi:hypothetical protein
MKKTTLKIAPLIAIAVMMPFAGLLANAKPYKIYSITVTEGDEEDKTEKKAKKETKKANTKFSLNNKAVKIYPDIIKREMHVVAKENKSEEELDFFVFGTDGTLVQHYKMGPKEHKRISGLEPGKYIYRVFKGDEETVTGQFVIR